VSLNIHARGTYVAIFNLSRSLCNTSELLWHCKIRSDACIVKAAARRIGGTKAIYSTPVMKIELPMERANLAGTGNQSGV
jgi:hypothetical protein